jgi:hypothetical protein
MTSRTFRHAALALATAGAAVTALGFAGTALAATADIAHRSGGASVEHFTELMGKQANYNVKIVLAAEGSGAYLSDADVTVRSLASNEIVLEHRMQGPVMLAALPPGRYAIRATLPFGVKAGSNDTQTRIIEVAAPTGDAARLLMYFNTGDQVYAASPDAFSLR